MTSMPSPRPAGDRLTGLDNQRHRALLEIVVVLPIVPRHRLPPWPCLTSVGIAPPSPAGDHPRISQKSRLSAASSLPRARADRLRLLEVVLHLLGRLGVHGVGYAWFVSRRGR